MAEGGVLQLQPVIFKREIIDGIRMYQKGIASFTGLIDKFNDYNKER